MIQVRWANRLREALDRRAPRRRGVDREPSSDSGTSTNQDFASSRRSASCCTPPHRPPRRPPTSERTCGNTRDPTQRIRPSSCADFDPDFGLDPDADLGRDADPDMALGMNFDMHGPSPAPATAAPAAASMADTACTAAASRVPPASSRPSRASRPWDHRSITRHSQPMAAPIGGSQIWSRRDLGERRSPEGESESPAVASTNACEGSIDSAKSSCTPESNRFDHGFDHGGSSRSARSAHGDGAGNSNGRRGLEWTSRSSLPPWVLPTSPDASLSLRTRLAGTARLRRAGITQGADPATNSAPDSPAVIASSCASACAYVRVSVCASASTSGST